MSIGRSARGGSNEGRFACLLAALLGRCVPGSFGDAMVGDLLEEHALRRARKARWRGDLWLLGAVLRLGSRWLAVRLFRSARATALAVTSSHRNKSQRKGDSALATLLGDLRFALRSFRRRALFTVTIVLTIAVGIAANTTVFSVTDALVLRPLSIPDLDRLVRVYGNIEGVNRDDLSPGDFVDLREGAPLLEQLHAERWWQPNLTGRERPERVTGRKVTPGYLELLGVRPIYGSTLAGNHEQGLRRVVVSYRLWQDKLGGDPSVVGEHLVLDGEPHEIVGVAPRRFEYPAAVELWAALDLDSAFFDGRKFQSVAAIGRLAPGATLREAEAQLAVTALRLEREFPETNTGRTVNAMPLAESAVDLGIPRFLAAWQVATVFLLLIACVNVANLLIARSTERRREMTLRAALGAGRPRILRLLFTESLLLALVGAALSVPLAWAGTVAVRASLPHRISRWVHGWDEINLDPRVLLFAALTAVVAAVLFGLVPAFHSSKVNLAAALGAGARTTGSGQRSRGLLVASQLSLAMVLLISSALMIRGTARITYGDQGFNPDRLLTATFDLPASSYPDPEAQRRTLDALLDAVRAVPEVRSAEATNMLPSAGGNTTRSVVVEGAVSTAGEERPTANLRVVTADFLPQLEIPILEGRGFSAVDHSDSQPVVVVSRSMAQQLWPGGSALGKRIRFAEDSADTWLTVVGVSGDVVHHWFMGGASPTAYQPFSQRARRGVYLSIRTAGAPRELAQTLRTTAAGVLPDVPLFDVMSIQDHIDERTAGLRFISGLMSVFGLIALGLAAIGVYGLMAQGVSRRRHEIGVRLALGAGNGQVLSSTLGRAARGLVIGVAAGVGFAYAAAVLMANNLFGVVRLDPVTFVQVIAMLLTVAVLATAMPAWRATRLDPARTLRSE